MINKYSSRDDPIRYKFCMDFTKALVSGGWRDKGVQLSGVKS